MAENIRELLESYHANTLWEMAEAAGLDVTTESGKRLRKAQVIRKMEAEFFTEERVAAALARLKDREREILDRLLLRGGEALTQDFERELTRANLVTSAPERPAPRYRFRVYPAGYVANPKRRNSNIFEDVVARLTLQGLVFSRGTPTSAGGTPLKVQFDPARVVFVPKEIRRHLPEPEPLPPGMAEWQPERVEAGDPELLLRDLYLYWDFVRRNEVPLLKTDLVGKRSLNALNPTLLAPDPLLDDARREDETGRLYLLRRLLQELGLVHKHQGELRLVNEDPLHVPNFWQEPLSRQVQGCLQAWIGLGRTQPWQKEADEYGARYRRARSTIVEVLRTLAPGAWFEIEDLLERVRVYEVGFLFADRGRLQEFRGSWYYSHVGTSFYGPVQQLRRKFDQLEQRFVEEAVRDFLHQIGLVDLGYSGERARAFRLNAIAETALSEVGTEQAASLDRRATGKLIVQPNFELMALGPVSFATLACLDLFAERAQADRGAFAYRLTRESAYEAQQAGLGVGEILRFLEEAAGTDVPQNVRRSLQEWGTHHERIVFRSGVNLLQAADADLLTELLSDEGIGGQIVRRVAPEVALLSEDGQKPLVDGLLARGLLPSVSGAEPEAADDSVIVEADGTIQPVHAVPGLQLRGRLERVAEPADDGRWRLTPESVRRAGGSKPEVERILADLRKLHRGTFPEGLPEQIKAWGGYYGDAQAGTLTLIEFRDRGALAELRRQPKLKSLLRPFPAGERALAVVPADRLSEVEEILARYGVNVDQGLKR